MSHDLAKVITHYSDRYLNSGWTKGQVEQNERQWINGATSYRIHITDFLAADDRAYVAGFVVVNGGPTGPIVQTSIIKENGQWRWYGNQRDAAP